MTIDVHLSVTAAGRNEAKSRNLRKEKANINQRNTRKISTRRSTSQKIIKNTKKVYLSIKMNTENIE